MKRETIGLAVACSLLCAAFSQSVEAASKSIRIDNEQGTGELWAQQSSVPSAITGLSGLTFGTNLSLTAFTYVPPAGGGTDEQDGSGLAISSPSVMYNWYTVPSTSSSFNPQSGVVGQIVAYTLSSNPGVSGVTSGDIEIQVNSCNAATIQCPSGATPANAAFTFDKVQYSSPSSPSAAGYAPDADFLFSSSGQLLGLINNVDSADPTISACSQASTCLSTIGWTSTGGTTTTTSAPEIDSTSAISALTLLAGVLAIVPGLRTGRRRLLAKC